PSPAVDDRNRRHERTARRRVVRFRETNHTPVMRRPPAGTRQYLFAVLSFLVLVLSVDILGLIEVSDPKASGMVLLAPSTVGSWKSLDADAHKTLDKEHDAIVEEIRLRIEHEHQLFALKFALEIGRAHV